ncbi:MAG TPA: plastocyanin/azurin family copper-binding protein [Nitrososphaeraceae archaeon]|jgi:plastocyanin|nr:plastocyanin/azurin family copper-binding protein [Nitrososphaeraceae archaeon]
MKNNYNDVTNSLLQTYVITGILFVIFIQSFIGLVFAEGFETSNSTSDALANKVSMVSSGDEGYLFVPDSIQVKVGDTITWTNDDETLHTVSSGSGTDENMGVLFDSGMMGKGKIFEHTFTVAGEYPYFCIVHPDMIGKVLVS